MLSLITRLCEDITLVDTLVKNIRLVDTEKRQLAYVAETEMKA